MGIEYIVSLYQSNTGPSSDWQTKQRYRVFPVVNFLCLVVMGVASVLSFSGVINHEKTNEVYGKYLNRFTTASWVHLFWISFFCYLILWVAVNCYLGMFLKRDNRLFNGRIGFLFCVITLSQSVWFLLWSHERLLFGTFVHIACVLIPLSVAYSRCRINYSFKGRHQKIRREFTDTTDILMISESSPLVNQQEQAFDHRKYRLISIWETVLFYPTFSAYLAWAIFHSLTNIWTMISSIHLISGGQPVFLSPQTWSIICQCVLTGLTIGVFVFWRRDPVAPLVILWNMAGLYSRQNDLTNGAWVEIFCIINMSLLSAVWVMLMGSLLLEKRFTERWWLLHDNPESPAPKMNEPEAPLSFEQQSMSSTTQTTTMVSPS